MPETILQEGNKLFTQKKYEEAIQKYSAAIKKTMETHGEECVSEDTIALLNRAYNNRAMCYLMMKQFEECIKDCDFVFKTDKSNEKTHYRKIKALEGLKNYEDALKIAVVACKTIPESSILKKLKLQLEKKLNVVDVEEIIHIATRVIENLVFTTKQLQSIEEKEFHDIWHVVDYFDPTKDKKFDIPCPPEKFAPHIEDPKKVRQLYFKFSHGSGQYKGGVNVSFIHEFSRIMKKKNCWFMGNKVVDVGIKIGNPRCKTVTYYEIAKGGVVVKDYEDHVWGFLQLDNDEIVNIDFLACQYDHFDMDPKTQFPVRLFTNEECSFEKYNEKPEKTVMSKDLKNFMRTFDKKFELKENAKRVFYASQVNLEKAFIEAGFLPKGFLQ